MAQDGVDTDVVPVPVDRDYVYGPQRGERRRVIAATYLRSQGEKDRDILQCQLDLEHAHTKLNGGNVDEEEPQYDGQEWDPTAAGFMARHLRIIQTEAGMPPLGASW